MWAPQCELHNDFCDQTAFKQASSAWTNSVASPLVGRLCIKKKIFCAKTKLEQVKIILLRPVHQPFDLWTFYVNFEGSLQIPLDGCDLIVESALWPSIRLEW